MYVISIVRIVNKKNTEITDIPDTVAIYCTASEAYRQFQYI